MGPIALHGGGEFSAADRPFLLALLAAARPSVASRVRACGPGDEVPDGSDRIRIALVTTAAAHQRPEQAAVNGERAFLLAAESERLAVRVDHVPVVDAATLQVRAVSTASSTKVSVVVPEDVLVATLAHNSVAVPPGTRHVQADVPASGVKELCASGT